MIKLAKALLETGLISHSSVQYQSEKFSLQLNRNTELEIFYFLYFSE